MGKKTGQAQRVKGNAQPSSSAKAAEMLQKVASNPDSFGFAPRDIAPIGVGTLLEDSFDSNLDSDFKMVLKKLYKKDSLTKLKSLEELKALIEAKSVEECVAILPYWSKSFTKLSIDYDRKIREMCQQTHEKLCVKVNKSLAPHLKTIMPYWLLAQSDTFGSASKIAESSFKAVFNETKRPEVVYFARDEIVNVIQDFLITQTAKTLSDMKMTSEDEAQQKYENIICMSLRALGLFLGYLFSDGSKMFKTDDPAESTIDKIEKLVLLENKFWKLSKDNSLKIRGEFFQLVHSSLLDHVILNKSFIESDQEKLKSLRQNLKAKVVPLVYYALDEDNSVCSYYVWNSIVKIEKSLPSSGSDSFWTLMNTKKAFIPKLVSLLRQHSNGNANTQNADFIYPNLSGLINSLIKSDVFTDSEEKAAFLRDILDKLYDGVSKHASSSSSSRVLPRFDQSCVKERMTSSLFDCSSLVLKENLNQFSQSDLDTRPKIFNFSQQIINHVVNVLDLYLTSRETKSLKSAELSFEFQFQQFFEKSIEKADTNEHSRLVGDYFWSQVESCIQNKQQPGEPEESISFLNNFCSLFSSLASELHSQQRIEQILQKVFENYLTRFTQSLESNETSSAEISLSCINRLVTSFNKCNFLAWIIKNNESDEKLKQFNEDFLKNAFARSSQNHDLMFSLVELYLLINMQCGSSNEQVNQKLDQLFGADDANTRQLLVKFLSKCKSNQIDSSTRSRLIKFINQSDEMKKVILTKLLSIDQVFVNNSSLAIELLQETIRHESHKYTNGDDFIKAVFDQLTNVNVLFLEASLANNSVDLAKLTNYLSLNVNLFDQINKQYLLKFLDLDKLWSILLNNLVLKQTLKGQLSKANHEKVELSLISLTTSISSLMISEHMTEIKPELFESLQSFIKNNIIVNKKANSNVIIDMLECFDRVLNKTQSVDQSWLDQVYQRVLFDTNGLFDSQQPFKQLYNSMLFNTDQTVRAGLLTKIYLTPSLNYLFADLQSGLFRVNREEEFKFDVDVQDANKLTFVLSLLSDYVTRNSMSSTLAERVMKLPLFTQNGWFYLVNSLLMIELFAEKTPKNLQIVRKFNHLLLDQSFLRLLLNSLGDNYREFLREIVINGSRLDLNSTAFFFQALLEKVSDNAELASGLDQFADSLKRSVGNNELLVFYLYEMPFAKYSIIKNINKLKENIGLYYQVFAHLIKNNVDNKLVELTEKIKSADNPASLSQLLIGFNSTIDVITKYVNIYISLVAESSDKSHKFYSLFHENEKTDEFIGTQLSQLMIQIFNLYKDLKQSLSTQGHGYGFFLDLHKDNQEDEVTFNQILFLDKLNAFLALFFEPIKKAHELALYFGENDWDFILCYTSAMTQSLDKRIVSKGFENNVTRVFSASFFQLQYSLVKVIKNRAEFDIRFPKNLITEWNGLFCKEIFDPLLVIYAKLSSKLSSVQQLDSGMLLILSRLSSLISETSFDRLLFNQLEPKFNVLDLGISGSLSNQLPESLKSLLNHLVPNLKHDINYVQLSSYGILRTLVKNYSNYINLENYNTETENQEEQKSSDSKMKLQIIDSLPHVLKSTLFELNELFSDIKNAIPIEECILKLPRIVEAGHEGSESDDELAESQQALRHDTNNKIMTYLLVNKLIMDMILNSNFDFKSKIINELREIDYIDNLMHMLFRLMPTSASAGLRVFRQSFEDLFESNNLETGSFSNEAVKDFACKMYKQSLQVIPAMIRDWRNISSKRISDLVDKFTTKHVSPVLLEEEIQQINRFSGPRGSVMDQLLRSIEAINLESDVCESNITIKGVLSTREVVSVYTMKELVIELVIKLPPNYPLDVLEVTSVRHQGVSENQWRNWLKNFMRTNFNNQNGSIIQALLVWKKNVDKKFSGVEECPICYSVIHSVTNQLPKIKCRTCKKLFHSTCLYKWFESSSKSTCPLCRSLF